MKPVELVERAIRNSSRRRDVVLDPQPSTHPRAANPELSRLLHLYVERFNQRDWDGLRELITADARLLVADRFAGPLADAPYFGRYERMTAPWRMAVGEVEGQMAVV